MKKASIAVYQDYVEMVIKKLHETGYVEIIDISRDEPAKLQETININSSEISVCVDIEQRLTRLISILKKVQKKPKGLKSLLNPPLPVVKTVDPKPLPDLLEESDRLLKTLESSIIKTDLKLTEFYDEEQKINELLEQVHLLSFFDVDIANITLSSHLMIVAGTTTQLPELEEQIKTIETAELYTHQLQSGKKSKWVVLLVAHRRVQEKLEKIYRDKISLFNLSSLSGTPHDAKASLEHKKNEIEQEQQSLQVVLQDNEEKYLSDFLVLREEIQLQRIEKEISKNFSKTKTTYIIQGWVLEKKEEMLQTLLVEVSDGYYEYSSEVPSVNPDNPPTYLETPRWAEGFKSLLGMFATPKYNEINPSIIMGIFFVLFFGVMLGDAGYGLIILILSLVGYFKFGKKSEMIYSWAFMGIWMGIITTIVGFLTNSFFGDFIPRFFQRSLYQPFIIAGIQFPVESLSKPLDILTLALVLGLVHLNVGIILGVYQAYKLKQYKSMLTKRFCFIPLQLGGGMLIGHYILGWNISTLLFNSAGILVIIGLVLLFIHAGPIGFFEITGYVGDWLSYARLLALGLATGGMALAFNVVSQLLGEMIPVVGIIIMIVLLVILHVVNLALQALGAGVHSLRLQYVEFFNRFYEGGGHEFSPFKMQRKYTKLKEEKTD